ncbi:MAG: SMP-30/gluconolactonase/LRE family protein [Steroidobacteraceae bacterium]
MKHGFVWMLSLVSVAGAMAGQPGPAMRGDGPPPAASSFRLERLDPGFDAVIAPGTKAVSLARGFGLNEGPLWVPEGRSGFLIVGGLLDNVLYRVDPNGRVSTYLEQAGYSGSDVDNVGAQTRSGRSHVLLIGPSCAGLDSKRRLVWCADNDRTVMRLETDGTRTVLARGAEGKRFSGPNDIAIARDDSIYLTDNDFGLRGAGRSPDKQMENAVWRLQEGQEPVRLITREALGGIPNGVALSPDERKIYLTAGSRLMRYALASDGSLSEAELFAEGAGIGDGMKVDAAGNVFSTSGGGPGVVRITSAAGRLLGFIHLPIVADEPKRQICATNLTFGGADGRDLFITACDEVYRLRLRVAQRM